MSESANPPEPCPTRLLVDSPADDDAFGGHDRLARAIAELVSTEDGGRAIALEGEWGSGKSTVLRLLGRHLDERRWTAIVFDAWSHQGDPLRRAFLDEVTTTLIDRDWVDHAVWTSRQEKLNRRMRTADIKTTPRLTRLGNLIVVSLAVLAPSGLAILSSGLSEPLRFGGAPILRIWIGLLMIAMPVLLVGLARIGPLRTLLTGKAPGESDSPESDGEDPDDGILSQLWFKQVTHQHSETIEDPEPTSIEFGDYFSDLMDAAIGSRTDRSVLIALDNLDRVSPQAGLTVLATLQTFLERSESRDPPWNKSVWFVVPFDRSGIEALWRSGHPTRTSESAATTDTSDGSLTAASDSRASVAEEFLDKMFGSRFRVPPVALSNWRGFLSSLLEDAFPKHDDEELALAREVIGLSAERPTPRHLKLVVNQVGALHRQWHDEIPLEHMAYFAVLASRGNIEARLRSGTLPESGYDHLLGQKDRLYGSLAALNFNVDVEVARQLLLRDPIEKALASGDPSALAELLEQPGFWDVILRLKFDGDPIHVVHAARALAEPLRAVEDRSRERLVGAQIKTAISSADVAIPLSGVAFEGLARAVDICKDDSVASRAVTILSENITFSTDEPIDDIEAWTEGALVVVAAVLALNDEFFVDARAAVEPPGGSRGFIIVLSHLLDRGETPPFSWLKRPQEGELAEVVIEDIAHDGPSRHVEDTYSTLVDLSPNENWDTIADTLKDELADVARDKPKESVLGCLNLLLLSNSARALEVRSDLAKGGQLLHYLQVHRQSPEIAAHAAFMYLQSEPDLPNPPGLGQAAAGHSFLTELVREPNKHPDVIAALTALSEGRERSATWLEITSENASLLPLTGQIMKNLYEAGFLKRLGTEPALEHWRTLQRCLTDEQFDGLYDQLERAGDLTEQLQAGLVAVDEARLYLAIARSSSVSGATLAWLDSGLQEVTKDEWNRAFSQNQPVLQLVDTLSQRKAISLGTAYQDALRDVSNTLASSSEQPAWLNDGTGERHLAALDSSVQVSMVDDLFGIAKRAGGNTGQAFFDAWGPVLQQPDRLKNDNAVIAEFVLPLIREQNLPGLRWLNDFLEHHPKVLVDAARPHQRDEFVGRIDDWLALDPDEDTVEQLESLKLALG